MIAAIYPAGHPDSDGKPARYFDIRKLTESECLRLMDVSEPNIRLLCGNRDKLSKSAVYKLAGNSIVVSCLYHIFKNIYLTQPDPEAQPSLFPEEVFRAVLPKTINLVTLCSGYDSQYMALCDLVAEARCRGIDTMANLLAWAEFDPESKKPIDQQPAVLAHNILFPEYHERNLGDMTKIDWQAFKDKNLSNNIDVDILTYSTPCQSISQAGKRAGIAKGSGTRSAVLWYTEEAIRVLRPKFLLQENVKALCNKVNKPHFDEWQEVCRNLGYTNYWTVMNAKDYGIPQNRERVFMLSVRNDLGLPDYKFPKPFKLDKCVADELDTNEVDRSYFLRPEGIIKFLQQNEAPFDNGGVIYLETDHKFSVEELADIRMSHASQDKSAQV